MFITGVGMICPVGLSAATACAAKRAGVSNLVELPFQDNEGLPIIGGAVPGIDWTASKPARLLELLTAALSDLIAGQPSGTRWEQVPLLVGLAEASRPGGGAVPVNSIVSEIEQKLGVHFHPHASRAFRSGHTAAFEAVGTARGLFQSGKGRAFIVCGVDSYLNASSLLWLNRQFRLKTPSNRDGVIPGECAAAVLMRGDRVPTAAAEVAGLGQANEAAHIMSGEPLLGLGLAGAARQALAEAGLGLHDIDLRLSDVTGELYGFKELPLVEGRLMRVVRKQEQPLWHWSEAIGDIGAAAGVAQLVLADQAFRKNYAPGQRAICLTGSVAGGRAAAVLKRCET